MFKLFTIKSQLTSLNKKHVLVFHFIWRGNLMSIYLLRKSWFSEWEHVLMLMTLPHLNYQTSKKSKIKVLYNLFPFWKTSSVNQRFIPLLATVDKKLFNIFQKKMADIVSWFYKKNLSPCPIHSVCFFESNSIWLDST